VADKQRDNGKEPLSERDREVLQELARRIVREAGLQRDPEQEARLENDKAHAEFLRALALVDTALLAGIVATVAFIGQLVPDSRDVLRASVAANVVGIVCAVGALMLATIVVAADAYTPSETVTRGRRWRDRLSIAAFVWFGVSALAFMLVVANNLNVLGR
jgi:hypothetical protein